MKRWVIVLSGTLFLAAVGLCFGSRSAAVATCCDPATVDFSLAGTPTSEPDGFEAHLWVVWCFPSDPEQAFVESVSGTTVNVSQGCVPECDAGITWFPNFWQPTGCNNAQQVVATGTKITPSQPAAFDGKACVWEGGIPVACDTEEVDIP
jgi:hypothetical protein